MRASYQSCHLHEINISTRQKTRVHETWKFASPLTPFLSEGASSTCKTLGWKSKGKSWKAIGVLSRHREPGHEAEGTSEAGLALQPEARVPGGCPISWVTESNK